MTSRWRAPSLLLTFTAALVILVIALPQYHYFGSDEQAAALGSALAFAVEWPLVFYLLLLRPLRAPWVLALPLAGLGYALWRLIWSGESASTTHAVLGIIVPAELVVLSVLATKLSRILGEMGRSRGQGELIERLARAARSQFGASRLIDILAYEAGLLYYALGGNPGIRLAPDETAHSYHQRSGLRLIYGVALLIGAMEILVVHLVVSAYSTEAAWVLTAVEFYGVIWVLGLVRSVADLPIVLGTDGLHVRFSVIYDLYVPFSNLESIQLTDLHGIDRRRRNYLSCAFASSPDCVLRLRSPQPARLPYGMRRSVDEIGLMVDEPRAFLELLKSRLEAHRSRMPI